jgi:ubiquinone/menaquinone biosynthesis C-methylase UbiE
LTGGASGACTHLFTRKEEVHVIPHVSLDEVARLERLDPSGNGAIWDERVESWEAVAASPAFRRLAEVVCELAKPRPEDEVVDLGAGTGLLALSLAPVVRTVMAVDSSAAMLDRLSEKAGQAQLSNIHPVLADLRCVPLADESVSLAVSNYALHHLPDEAKELALSEVRRVLVPGGRLVVCDMMFALSLSPRDRNVIFDKLALIARQGPAGLLRIAKNGIRILTRKWEHPSPAESWEQMLSDRHFTDISVQLLEHEAGIAVARRPARSDEP